MNHVTRNLDARRAQLGITITQLEAATGMARQQFYRVASNPDATSVRSLQKVAMMLYCPVKHLLSEDPADAVRYPLPPASFLDTLRVNRTRFGFDGGDLIEWADYEAIIKAADATDAPTA